MTEKPPVLLPDDTEILTVITTEQQIRREDVIQYIRLSPSINGWKNGQITYSTPSPEDLQKREELVASWGETQDAYCTKLAGFGFILPSDFTLPPEDLYHNDPSTPVALRALRDNDPEIFKKDASSIIIAESILLKTLKQRQRQQIAG